MLISLLNVSNLLQNGYFPIFYILPQTLRIDCYIQYLFKTLLQQGISETAFYGDLVYKIQNNCWKTYFSDHLKQIIKRYKKKLYIT